MTECLAALAFLLVSSVWVYTDSSKLARRYGKPVGGNSPLFWSLATFVFWIVGFPAYVITRMIWVNRQEEAQPDISSKPTTIATFFCSQCGAGLLPESRFCPACGHSC
jgi:zinc-ribbon domain